MLKWRATTIHRRWKKTLPYVDEGDWWDKGGSLPTSLRWGRWIWIVPSLFYNIYMRKNNYRSRSRSNHKHKKYFNNYAGIVIQDHRPAGIEKGDTEIVRVLPANLIHLLPVLPIPHPHPPVPAAPRLRVRLGGGMRLLTSATRREKDSTIDIELKDYWAMEPSDELLNANTRIEYMPSKYTLYKVDHQAGGKVHPVSQNLKVNRQENKSKGPNGGRRDCQVSLILLPP